MMTPLLFLLKVLSLVLILRVSECQSLTLSSSSVSPNYAKSQSSLYTFSFNAGSSFQTNFDLRIYFPSHFDLTSPSSCAFYLNNIFKTSAVCSLYNSTNEIVFSNLNIA